MATEDRIQPPGANPPAAAPTAVTKAPTAPVPATKTKNPVADRFAEMWHGLKPHLTRRVLYVVVAITLIVGGYFIFLEYRRRSTNDNSEGWVKWLMLSDPTEVRGAAEKVNAGEKGKPGWTPPGPESPNYNEYTVAVQRQLLDDFAKSMPDTTQARVAQMQLGRFLMSRAMPAIGLNAGIQKPSPHAAEVLQTVAETFEKLEPQLADDPALQEEAILTSGKARETLGEVEKALTQYHKLADSDKTKNSAAGRDAAACIKRLGPPDSDARKEAERLARMYVKSAAQ